MATPPFKIRSDADLPTGEGVATARRIVEDDTLGATELCLVLEDCELRFEGVRSGNAMLFRTDNDSGKRFVALDAYERDRVVALVELIAENPDATIAAIDWQEDEAGMWHYLVIAVAAAMILITIYGLYIEFIR